MIISLYVTLIASIIIVLTSIFMIRKISIPIRSHIFIKNKEQAPYVTDTNKITATTQTDNPTGIIIGWTTFTLGMILLITTILLFILAPLHGMEKANIKTTNFIDVLTSTINTPMQSKANPKDIKPGSIIIYYKFDCPDCHAIYKDLSKNIKGISDVYWISSRSTTGEKLLKEYPVEEVPSAIYIRNNTLSGSTKYSKFLLYTHDENENVILNTDEKYGLPRLLKLKENNK